MSNFWKQPGTVLAGKYRVERCLGEGAMGIVLAVRHLVLGEVVAMKLLHGDEAQESELLERFRREARAMMRIKSEHVVRTYDVGVLEDDTPYLVMEYLEGEDLARRLARAGPLPFVQVVDCVMQACEALAHAHALGIVHRDLKPSNLFLVRRVDGRECIKVIDFGIAKQSNSGATTAGLRLTRTAQVIGSPRYMAPEQMTSSKDVDARSDIWSLGIVLFELLSGHTPFVGKTLVSLYRDITTSDPPSLLRYRPDLPEGLAAIVRICLMKDRAQRFQSVVELCAALKPYASPNCPILPELLAQVFGHASHRSASSMPPGPLLWQDPVAVTSGAGSTQQVFGRTTMSKPNQHVGGWLLVALSFTCIVVALGVSLVRRADFAMFRSTSTSAVVTAPPLETPTPTTPTLATPTPATPTVLPSATPSVVSAVPPIPSPLSALARGRPISGASSVPSPVSSAKVDLIGY